MVGVPETIDRLELATQSLQAASGALANAAPLLSSSEQVPKQNKLYLVFGIPASGKTTIAQKMQPANPNLRRLNKDDLRSAIDCGIYSPAKEALIRSIHSQIAIESLKAGFDLVCDDAGLVEARHRDVLIDIADRLGVEVVWDLQLIDVPVQECIDRDSKREKPVGEAVIRSFAEKMEAFKAELFD